MNLQSITMSEKNYEAAITLIDEAHAQDPNIKSVDGEDIPYELHYAKQMTKYLEKRSPIASPVLKVAIRAQHFRRWEIPRGNYEMDRSGYLEWRKGLMDRAADFVSEICLKCDFTVEEAEAVAKLLRKEDRKNNAETQILEDVACLVFLDDQFEAFEKEHDEAKIIRILRMTWAKMSAQGHMIVDEIHMSPSSEILVKKALGKK